MQREITKIGLAVVDANHLLLVRKRASDFYILPGGKPEIGEDDLTALSREISEELGCRVNPSSVAFLGAFSDDAAGIADTTVTIRLYGGSLIGVPSPASEIEELRWFCPQRPEGIKLAPSLVNSIIPFLFEQSHLLKRKAG